MPKMRHTHKLVLSLSTAAFLVLPAFAQFEACVGAKGAQKAGYCKYEYEAYLTRGRCVDRTGGWIDGASVSLNVRSPGHLKHGRSGTTYVNFNDRTGPDVCHRACASTTITYQGRQYTKSTCNRKSYQ